MSVVVTGGPAAHPRYLRALTRVTPRVAVLHMPDGHDGLDWLVPVASQVAQLAVYDSRGDLSALAHFPRLKRLTLTYRPHDRTLPLVQQATTLRRYAGPWFPALDPVLASPTLTDVMLEQPPRDVAARLTAPLQQLRLLSARKLATVPVLSSADTLTSLQIAGGRALDLSGVAAYTRLDHLSVYGRTPLTSFGELTRCPSLRRLDLAECYAVDDIDA